MIFTSLINRNDTILKGFINYENPNELIEKGKKVPIGEITTHKDGKKYKKQANGKWIQVSESHGLTK